MLLTVEDVRLLVAVASWGRERGLPQDMSQWPKSALQDLGAFTTEYKKQRQEEERQKFIRWREQQATAPVPVRRPSSREWVRAQLIDGPLSRAEFNRRARRDRYGYTQTAYARRALGVQKQKRGQGKHQRTYYLLPKENRSHAPRSSAADGEAAQPAV